MFSFRQLWLPVIAAALLAATTASPALAITPHRGAAVPHGHVISVSTPGQQSVPVTVGAPTISLTPRSSMSLVEALQSAPAGAVIHLAGGTYPKIYDSVARSGWVTVTGAGDTTPPVIQGAQLWGSQYLRFVSVRFSSSMMLSHGPNGHSQPTANIALIDSTIDCGSNGSLDGGARHGNTGIQVRGASQNVTLEGDLITNCTTGFASVAQDNVSTGVSITYSTIQGVSGDAIDLGGLANVDIDHDIVGGAQHAGPESLWHNDGIQFFGNDTNVAIANNVIANSGGQLIFIQDAVKSDYTGSSVNSNILVQNNLIYGAGAYAVQDQGGLNVRFVGNTIWDSHFGGLLIRQSGYTKIIPTSTVIEGNILSGYGTQNVVPAVENDNLIAGYISPKIRAQTGPNDLLGATPQYADAADGNFELTGLIPASGNVSPPTSQASASASSPSATPTPVPSSLGSTLTGSFGAPWYGVPGS